MKTCPNCGTACGDDTRFCNACGTALEAAPVSTAPADDRQAPLTKQEFLKLPENKALKKQLNMSAVICYIFAGLTVLAAIIGGSYLSLIDAAILLGMGLGVHLKQSRVCAIILLAYAVFDVIVLSISSGRITGVPVFLAGAYAVISTFRLDKAWKDRA